MRRGIIKDKRWTYYENAQVTSCEQWPAAIRDEMAGLGLP
jgi:hypothetical protein